jgi:hypothetical protein
MTVAGTAAIKKSKKNGLPGTMLDWKEDRVSAFKWRK